ncbi:MAG: holo-ACP synthase [Acidimicrobiales bacterium]
MATLGVGVDLVNVQRFAEVLNRHPRLIDRLFTDAEQRDAKGRHERLAARFAAKEAVLKTLGVGVGGASWRSIEVATNDAGAPCVVLHERARQLAEGAGVTTMHLSLSHTNETAVAMVVASGDEFGVR